MAVLLATALLGLTTACGDAGAALTNPDGPGALDNPQSTVAVVEIEADTALAVGDSADFKVRALDAAGNPVQDPEISWSSGNPEVASVNDEGSVRALASGEVVITASAESASDSADVRVSNEEDQQDDESDPNGDDSDPWPNEPEGFRAMTERSFDHLTEDGWTASNAFEVVEVTGLPRSASSTGRIKYPAGYSGGGTPGWTTRSGLDSFGHRQLYVSFWVKLSESWQGHDSGVNKIGYVWLHNNPVVVPNAWVIDDSPITTQLRLENTPDGARNLNANVSDIRMKRGEWHRWEILLVVNSGDNRDGQAHWWIDGVKAGEHYDVTYGSSSQAKAWDILAWRPTWGGRDDLVNQDMAIWMDHLYASGK